MRHCIWAAGIFLWALIVQCKSKNTPRRDNGSAMSELSLQMRQMHQACLRLRSQISQNEPLEDVRRDFAAIKTATPTDENTKTPAFDPMADAFLYAVDNLYQGQGDLRSKFNVVVQNCLSCHQQHCPGPIALIKKLALDSAVATQKKPF